MGVYRHAWAHKIVLEGNCKNQPHSFSIIYQHIKNLTDASLVSLIITEKRTKQYHWPRRALPVARKMHHSNFFSTSTQNLKNDKILHKTMNP